MAPTTAFTPKHAYAAQPAVYYNDGRELSLLSYIHTHASLPSLRNNPSAILAAIDEYAAAHYLMNIGEQKGSLVCPLITAHAPRTSIELGSYIGYSALLFGSTAVAADPRARYYAIEQNPVFAAITMSFVALAGLEENVRVITGASGEALRGIKERVGEGGVDFVFLDHLKSLYTPDLQLAERLGVVRVGTLVVADNMVKPGNPVYHRWVNLSCEEKMKEGGGDGRLVYESRLVEGWEPQGVPDAIEITRCVGRMEE